MATKERSLAETSSALERHRFVTIGGSMGAVIAFIAAGMLEDVLLLALGAAVGVAVGLTVWAYVAKTARERAAGDLLDLRKADLEAQARRLGVSNPSAMNKAELAEAIAARTDETDPSGELMIETVGALHEKVTQTVGQARDKLEQRHGDSHQR